MQKDIQAILDKVSSGNGTAEEQQIAKYWLHQLHQDEESGLSENELDTLSAEMWNEIRNKRKAESPRRRILWPAIAATACLVLALGSVLYFNQSGTSHDNKVARVLFQDIPAGGNKAYLTLANGKKISLTDASSGAIATQAGIQISKTSSGQLIYTITNQKATGQTDYYNRIETPRGGQYQLNLPDGTKVWLNSASSLNYLVNFSSKEERIVELTGEAYFEVAKDKKHPFLVRSAGQEVKVLGTHFNVNAYVDESGVKTTLLEGSVRVNNDVVLVPGEQSVYAGGKLNVKAVNASDAIDWKNGEFVFNKDPLTDILRKVSRWYNVDIIYIRDLGSGLDVPTFSGSVSRFENVSVILRMLEETSNVRFAIEGKTIKVK
ncbi:anti-sigma factor [Pedobacter ginsengisoli]|uniref:Anti-sigma factor n=1 Tax=Pedobacter ginsengisoli TaxID=363852 RepID=A0A2D1U0Z5_9SPHI|nr:FecR domain-containing protein [Pedobacter ginsengisoli]ATP55292.1 anti-sigma factor [Pedobacter ginsengisoli]